MRYAARRARCTPWRTAFQRVFLVTWTAQGDYARSRHTACLMAGVARASARNPRLDVSSAN